MTTKEILSDPNLVAYCGLYCGACMAYRKGRCTGCHENVKATWCSVRTCCRDNSRTTCADCGEFSDPRACKKYNNFISRLFGLLFRSNRPACIDQIRRLGVKAHADDMAAKKRQSFPR